MNPLRDYQAFDVELIKEELKEHNSTLYVAATGLGKTRVMVEMALSVYPKRTILLAHRTELIKQAKDAFEACGLTCAIEKAEQTATTDMFTCAPVVLASVQTLLSGNDDWTRMQRFNPMDFALLLYDESHHSVTPGNKRIVDYFTGGNPSLRVLGVTATPDRADEEALGQIFETVASERDILWGRDNGWIVDIDQRFVAVKGLDFSGINITCGDLNGGALAKVMETEACVQGIVQPTIETLFGLEPHALSNLPVAEWASQLRGKPPQHRAIVFTISVAQAEMLSNIFNRVMEGLAGWVCGKTKDDNRAKILERFSVGGDVNILVNVGVTTEGYDNPAVDMIVMGRPTLSRSLYAQCLGRGTRPIPGLVDKCANAEDRKRAIAESAKPSVIVLDFVGNSGRHKLVSSVDVLGGKYSDDAIARCKRTAEKSDKPVRVLELLEEEEAKLRAEAEERKRQEEAKKVKLVAKSKYVMVSNSPFDLLNLQPARSRGWDEGKTLTEKQRKSLISAGVNPDTLTYAEGCQMVGEIIKRWRNNLCTLKQAKQLKRFGYDINVSYDDAHKIIDRIAANGWQRPPEGQ